MNTTQVKKACLDEIERAYRIVEEEHGVNIPRIPITFSNRMTKCAGGASYRELYGEIRPVGIKLSLPILKLNPEEFIRDTPAHEAMHIAQFVLFGHADTSIEGGHGPKWRGLMKLIDRDPGRYHSMKTVDIRVNTYCGCDSPHKISKQRAGKIRKGTRYRCGSCNQVLKLTPYGTPPVKVSQDRPEPRGMWTPPVAAPVKKHPVVNTKTGVNAVVAMLKIFKNRGMGLTTVLDNAKVLSAMAAQAQVTGAECRTMVRNNWSRV